ncbi:MAG: potassium/proton antiporter [bacterium]
MNTDPVAVAIVAGAAVIIVAVVGVRFAGRLGVPGLLLYLLIGVALGLLFPDVGVEDPGLAVILGYSALILILAQGGLTTPWNRLRPVLWPSLALATVGVAVSIAVVAVPLIWLVGMDTRLALILASVVAATDAAAVFSVLRRVNAVPRLRTLLEGEAGFNDAPVVVIVTLLATSAMTAEPWLIPVLVVLELLGGAAIGIALGFAARWIMPRIALPAVGLYPIAALTVIVASYGLALLAHASGFMAVYVAAVILGSAENLPHRRSILGFSDGLSWIAEIGLFVMLGLLADPTRLPQSLGIALVAVLAVTFLGRPLAALVSLAPFRMPGRFIAFTSVAGLRGAVPIVFAAIPLGLGMPGAEIVFDATFILVFVLTAVQTPALPWVARRLGVESTERTGELDVDVAPLDEMHAVVLGFDLPPSSGMAGMFVRELGLPEGAAVSLVIRDQRASVPDSETRLRVGDRLVVVAAEGCRSETERRLRALDRAGRLAGWRGERGDQGD